MKSRSQTLACWIAVFFAIPLAAGCGSSSSGEGGQLDALAGKYLLASEPEGAQGLLELKAALESSSAPTAVVVEARVGGSGDQTWDPNQAAFVVSDVSLFDDSSTDVDFGHDADDCPFCRAEKKKRLAGRALVQIVDEDGEALSVDARKLLGLREGQTVVVCGEGQIDSLDMLVVKASGVYVRR